ncbi:MAG: replication-relaxation family protein, partial [Acidimicrobiales bacterium]
MLTTGQLTDLAFANVITAQHRLTVLHRLRVVDRFRHWRPVGSDPYHYVLDEIGAEIVAADQGVDPPRRGQVRSRAMSLADSQRLADLVGVNGVFCSLARWARTTPGADLERWWSERRCAEEWDGVIRPDGYGQLRCGAHVVEFVLEYDRGTEQFDRLAGMLDVSPDLAEAVGWAPWLAFWFPSPRREAEARRVLDRHGVAVVTGADGLG